MGVVDGVAVLTALTPDDLEPALATLTSAFVADPIIRWAIPSAARYFKAFPRFVRALAGDALARGTAVGADDLSGIAIWLPPGTGPDPMRVLPVIYRGAPAAMRPDLDGFFGQMAARRPAARHWYLPLIGVDPPGQNRGLGTALLRHGIGLADRDGLPVYLEATSRRNRDLYARNGFAVLGRIQHGGSPTAWSMLRPSSPGM
jgi:GNAT superfamily N-acetyltransferase